MSVGLHPGLSYAEYETLRGVRCTILKAMRPTALHGHHAMMANDDPKPCFKLGDAGHTAALEPDEYDNRYAIAPADLYTLDGSPRKRLNAAKAAQLVEWQAANGEKTIISEDQDRRAREIGAAIQGHETARALLASPGLTEVSAVWDDPVTGERCKGRADKIVRYQGATYVVELKTTRNASPWTFAKDCHAMGYHMAAAYYLDGLNVLSKADRLHVFIAVESEAPFAVAVYTLTPQAIEQGQYDYRAALAEYSACVKSGDWPGFPERIIGLDLPKYAYDVELDNE